MAQAPPRQLAAFGMRGFLGTFICRQRQLALLRLLVGQPTSSRNPFSIAPTRLRVISRRGNPYRVHYQASFSPSQLAAAANSGLSVAYSAGIQSDSGNTFTVQQATPEPSTLMLLVSGLTGLGVVSRRDVERSGPPLCHHPVHFLPHLARASSRPTPASTASS